MAQEVYGRLKTISVTKAVAAAGNYGAEDVISESASSGTAWNFALIGKGLGFSGYITKAQVIVETTAQAHRLTLYLFNVTPTAEDNDNVANTAVVHADLASFVGKIDFPALESLGGGDSDTVSTPSTSGNLPLAFTCADGDSDLYGILVTRDAFTNETATDDYTITLTAEQYEE